ncbi:MAG: hypothetical protein DRN03_04960, partial [Thermoplasmata archaeon]
SYTYGIAPPREEIVIMFRMLRMKYKLLHDISRYISDVTYNLCTNCGKPIFEHEYNSETDYERGVCGTCVMLEKQKEPWKITGKVYYFMSGFSDHVKIGYSSSWEKRIEVHQVGHAWKGKLLLLHDGSYRHEKALHKRFESYKYGGEWFRYEGELKDYIESLRNGEEIKKAQ